MLLPLLNLACLGYIAFAILSLVRDRRSGGAREIHAFHPAVRFVVSGGLPVAVAVTMTYLFLIVGGSTTIQFNVGSSSRMNVWSTWVGLWPLFFILTVAGVFACSVWVIICASKKKRRPSIPTAGASLLLHILAFLSIFVYSPSA